MGRPSLISLQDRRHLVVVQQCIGGLADVRSAFATDVPSDILLSVRARSPEWLSMRMISY